MERRRTIRPRIDRDAARIRRLDWSKGPSERGAKYPLKRPLHERLTRPLVRLVPIALVAVLAWIISQGFMASREERLWADIQVAYSIHDVADVALMAGFLSRYPGSEYAPDVSYYYASMAHDVDGCGAVEPIWESVLSSNVPQRAAEASVRLGDCASTRGDTASAMKHFRRAVGIAPVSAWTAEAALKAGRLSDHNDALEDALDFYRSLWKLPATTTHLVVASHRIGEIYFDALSVFQREYSVRSAETLWGIAARQGVTIDALLAVNPHIRNPRRIEIGAKISIPLRGFGLTVSLADRALYLTYGRLAIRPYPVVIGADETPTPAGNFRISAIENRSDQLATLAQDHLGIRAEDIGDYWLGFGKPPRGIHGGAASENLRNAITSGAIQLLDEDMAEVAQLVPRGTPLRIAEHVTSIEWLPVPTSR